MMNEKYAQRPHRDRDEKMHEQDRNRQANGHDQKQPKPSCGIYRPANLLEAESIIMRHTSPLSIASPGKSRMAP